MAKPDLPILAFPTQADLETWIAAQPAGSPGLRLKLAKKGAGIASVSRAEAVEAGLRHGWIDGQAKPVDETTWLLRFTPRRPRSIWSQMNCQAAEALIAAGRMLPGGVAEIDRAKADGRWARAYAPPSTAQVPDDLTEALADDAAAAELFARLDAANRYAILHRIHDAKKPETRAARIATFVAMLARGETIYPLRQPRKPKSPG